MTTQLVSSGGDVLAARLVEQLTDLLQAGGDAEEFIAAHPEQGEMLRRLLPAVRMMADLSRSGEPGASATGVLELGELGDFRLIREVGRGGMGIVYEAEQISLRRRVALKVLPFAATMDPRHLQRFHNEALAAASLHHEHIAPVHGVGCERGVHYYAMQYIDGLTLAQVIDELNQAKNIHHGGTEDTERKQVTSPLLSPCSPCLRGKEFFRRIAALVADAADALEYAHSAGVVHRDVKPGNLMVDAAGKVWVTDFGLARFGPDTGLTMTGDLLGTLRYMAPEQALAKHGLVDHRADVYGLGATLYELLTGQPAVGGADKQEILKRIAFEEPVALRKLDQAIPAELETITLKCQAKEPKERYATAGELAADLRRWLGHKAIKAKPPTIWQLSARRVQRHPRVVSATFAVVVLAAIGAFASLYFIDRQKRRAEDAYGRARLALDELTELVVYDWLAKQAILTDEQKQFLGRMLGHYKWLASQPGGDLQSCVGIGRASLRAGNIRWKLGQATEAESEYNQAIELNGQLLDRFPTEPAFQRTIAHAHRGRAQTLLALGRHADSQAAVKKALLLHEQLVGQHPTEWAYRYDLADALLDYAERLLSDLGGKPSEAEECYLRGLNLVQDLPTALPGCQHLRARLNTHLGRFYFERMARPADAKKHLDRGIELLDRLLSSTGSVSDRVRYLEDLAVGLTALGHDLGAAGLGRPQDAVVADRRAVSISERLVNDYPSVPGYRHQLAKSLHGLGNHLGTDLNRFEDGAAQYRRSISILEKLAADNPKQTDYASSQVNAMLRLSKLCSAADKAEEAEQTARLALAIAERLVIEHPDVKAYRLNLAVTFTRRGVELCDKLGKPVEAEKLFRRAVDLAPGEPEFRYNLGVALQNQRRFAEAETEYRRALELRPGYPGVRYNVACIAALRGCRQGNEADKSETAERFESRRKSLDWLIAELATWSKLADKPAGRLRIRQTMQHWQTDVDLAGVRDAAALAKLPEAERVTWQKLWADVTALQKRCEEQPHGKEPPPKP